MTPEAIAYRLKEIMEDEMTGQTGRVMGSGSQYDMLLRYAKRGESNGMGPVLDATMEAEQGGTRIKGKIATPIGAYVFVVFWFVFLSIFILVGAGVGLFASTDDVDGPIWMFSAMFIGIPLLMMVIGFYAFRAGFRSGKSHPEKILAFLEKELKARPARPEVKVH